LVLGIEDLFVFALLKYKFLTFTKLRAVRKNISAKSIYTVATTEILTTLMCGQSAGTATTPHVYNFYSISYTTLQVKRTAPPNQSIVDDLLKCVS